MTTSYIHSHTDAHVYLDTIALTSILANFILRVAPRGGATDGLITQPIFTRDPAVIAVTALLAPLVFVKCLVGLLVYPVEGILTGLGDYKYLAVVHTFNCFIMTGWGLTVQRLHLGIEYLWGGVSGGKM